MYKILIIIALFIVSNATAQLSLKYSLPITWVNYELKNPTKKYAGFEIGLSYEHTLKENLKINIGGLYGQSNIDVKSIYTNGSGMLIDNKERIRYIEFPAYFKLNILKYYLLAGSSIVIPFNYNSSASINGGAGITIIKKITFDVKYNYYLKEINYSGYNLNKLNFTLGYIIRNSHSLSSVTF